jgi:hypothetical protein
VSVQLRPVNVCGIRTQYNDYKICLVQSARLPFLVPLTITGIRYEYNGAYPV